MIEILKKYIYLSHLLCANAREVTKFYRFRTFEPNTKMIYKSLKPLNYW